MVNEEMSENVVDMTADENEELFEEAEETCEETDEVEEVEEDFEETDEADEETEEDEVPLENSDEENEVILAEEASLEGDTTEGQDGASGENPEEGKKEKFKLTAPANLEEILPKICRKRARKLIYRPNEALINITVTVLGTDKNNEEKIKVKNILDAEIQEGVKLGYLDKFDGLKTGEIKEEYENDIIYEFAEQEFKRTGLMLDGNKVKVYVFDWDMQACHHVGYIEGEEVEQLKPYLADSEKYSFDVCGIITGGKFRKVIKGEDGKVKVERGNDGKYGMELDVTVIDRKD